VISDHPVLGVDVPVAQVTAGELSGELGALARGDVLETLEATEDADGLVLTTKADVQLRDLVRCSVTSVLDGGGDGVKNVPELGVTTGSTRRGKTGLSGAVDSVRGQELLSSGTEATLNITGSLLGGRRGVEVRVDESVEVSDAGGESVVFQVGAEVTEGRSGDSLANRRAVRGVADTLDLEVRVLEGGPRQTETELVERSSRVVGSSFSVGAGR